MGSEYVSLLKDLLRVLTLDEINELTTRPDTDNLVPLTELLDMKVSEMRFRRFYPEEMPFKRPILKRAGNAAHRLFKFLGAAGSKNILIKTEAQGEGPLEENPHNPLLSARGQQMLEAYRQAQRQTRKRAA